MKLLIDIGNTSSKLAVALGDEMLHLERLAEPWSAALRRLLASHAIERIVVSCVGREGPTLQEALAELNLSATWLTHDTPCAIKDVPKGYGADRLAADLGAYHGQHALLVIDAGTCITYDLIIDGYLCGGVISPGVQLRLDAMHAHTALLPLIDARKACTDVPVNALQLMAGSTEGCMLSAAVHGVRFEVEGYVRALRAEHPDLDVVLTGGNRIELPPDLPHSYDPLLVLRGLNRL